MLLIVVLKLPKIAFFGQILVLRQVLILRKQSVYGGICIIFPLICTIHHLAYFLSLKIVLRSPVRPQCHKLILGAIIIR